LQIISFPCFHGSEMLYCNMFLHGAKHSANPAPRNVRRHRNPGWQARHRSCFGRIRGGRNHPRQAQGRSIAHRGHGFIERYPFVLNKFRGL